MLLRAYCSKQELYDLFFPLVGQNSDFRNFVFQYYKEVTDVSEFASLANMTVRSFQRWFKAEFSCSAREWLLERRAESILFELRTTEKDLFTIATENGFSTMSYFTTFCKKHLGMTPSELRGQRRPSQTQPFLPEIFSAPGFHELYRTADMNAAFRQDDRTGRRENE